MSKRKGVHTMMKIDYLRSIAAVLLGSRSGLLHASWLRGSARRVGETLDEIGIVRLRVSYTMSC